MTLRNAFEGLATESSMLDLVAAVEEVGRDTDQIYFATNNCGADSVGELFTYDTNLEAVLGTQSLTDGDKLKTRAMAIDTYVRGRIGLLDERIEIDTKGFSTGIVQISGTFAGTISFEATTDGGNFVSIAGMIAGGGAMATSTTGVGLFRFNTAGLVRLRARFTAFTSGTALITLAATSESGLVSIMGPVTGSQSQPLSQRATSYENNTYDTNLANVLGAAALWRTGFTAVENVVAPTVNPTRPTTYAHPSFANYPQVFPRVRVEVAGDQKIPIAQDPQTKRLFVAQPEMYAMLEQVLIQLKLQNQMFMQVYDIEPPQGWDEVR